MFWVRIKWIAALAVLPAAAAAESYICIADAAAFVTDSDGKTASAHVADASNQKWVLSNQNGKWVLRTLGDSSPLFDACRSEFFCERSSGYAGTFYRDAGGTRFAIIWLTVDGKDENLIVAKGRCSAV